MLSRNTLSDLGRLAKLLSRRGVPANAPDLLVKRISLSNQISVTFSVICFLSSIALLMAGLRGLALVEFICALSFSLCPPLNGTGHTLASRIGTIVIANFRFLILCDLLKMGVGIHLYLFSLVSLPFFLFRPTNKLSLMSSVSMPLAIFLATRLGDLNLFAEPVRVNLPDWFYWASNFSASILFFSNMVYFYRSTEKAESKMEDLLQKLRTSEQYYRSIVETTGEGIWIIDAEQRTSYVNQRLALMLGYTSSEVDSKLLDYPVLDFVDPDFHQTLKASLVRLPVEGRAQFDLKLKRKDGSDQWVILSASPLFNAHGRYRGALAMLLDINDRKESEAKIANQQMQLIVTSKFSALGEMAGGIAHEINTPLSVIHVLSGQFQDLLADESPDKERLSAISNKIESTAFRIGKIISGLRFFSRDGTADPFEQIELSRIFSETLTFCSEKFTIGGVKLNIDPLPSNLVLECRAIQISQVILNLLNNAYDAVAGLPDKWVTLGASIVGNSIQIKVTDSGSGIPPELRSKIFQPFFTTKEVGKGTGLGLSVSKGIVESHQGELFLDGQCPNTRIVLTLPQVQSKTQNQRRAA